MGINIKYIFAIITGVLIFSCSGVQDKDGEVIAVPDFNMPNNYLAFKAAAEIKIDGKISSEEWDEAPWSEWFRDIEGDKKPDPSFRTRMKMLWDESFLYVAAELEEPHVWANIMERDAVIFYDNDFEVFIDPDDDTHDYYELEINAYGTAWDLLLLQPYRDGGPPVDSWDIQGLQVGIDVQGTINDPSDIDTGWTVELAIPMAVLEECAPGGEIPSPGDQWRINFSRVEWQVEVDNGSYVKINDPETGKPLPEDNWVWSPQGYINMHMPEYWGYIQFEGLKTGTSDAKFNKPADIQERWILRNLYYRQFEFNEDKGQYASGLEQLKWPSDSLKSAGYEVVMHSGDYGYEAYIKKAGRETVLIINEKGLIKKQ